MNKFLEHIKSREYNVETAYDWIVTRLMTKKMSGGLKTNGRLDAYDSEPLFGGRLFRGNIYVFQYDAKNPTKYEYRGQSAYFTDDMPIVLLTYEKGRMFRGINLNFCNKGLRTLILNMICNIDEDFYERRAQIMAFNKTMPISDKVYKFLSDDRAEKAMIEELRRHYPDVDYGMIFRNYSIDGVKGLRLVEPWQWEYLPYLGYPSSLRDGTLTAIQKISGIDKVKI